MKLVHLSQVVFPGEGPSVQTKKNEGKETELHSEHNYMQIYKTGNLDASPVRVCVLARKDLVPGIRGMQNFGRVGETQLSLRNLRNVGIEINYSRLWLQPPLAREQ